MMAALARPRTVQELAEVLDVPVPALLEAPVFVEELADDSRLVAPGTVFFARRGSEVDGLRFVQAAVEAGAVAVVAATEVRTRVPVLRVHDVDVALRRAADAWYGRPQDALDLVGITGTKGKTTVAALVAAGLRAGDRKAAVFGTIAHDIGGAQEPSGNTTPGALELRRLLARAREAGCDVAVIEVSSHALHQGRVEGLSFRSVVFTNLASDHLDYHRTPGAYFAAKARLFEAADAASTAVLNREDAAWPELAARCRGAVLTYGTAPEADLRAEGIAVSLDGTRFRLVVAGDGQCDVESGLVGRHNVMNALAAIGACVGLGHDPIVAAQGVATVTRVPGRLQRVTRRELHDVDVFVDYAHTDDSLRQALGFLRDAGAAPITCVIGCGGDRDVTKRPRMAQAAAELAEHVVLTSDNPRTEDPDAILDEMAAGLTAGQAVRVERVVDRRAAIERAVLGAPPGSAVLVAGKGHETYQIHGTQRVPFDDVEEVRRALERRAASATKGDPAGGTSPA
jgi:UDP-N-acetylmuramoyl-L-alanyl-D-glutamate--2,6-diaminopimelate ligase